MAELQTQDKQAETFECNNDPNFVSIPHMVSLNGRDSWTPGEGLHSHNKHFKQRG